MSVLNQNPPQNQYVGDGSTKTFAYTFEIIADANGNPEISVYVNGVLQTITTDFAVANVGNESGGTVTFVTAPASGAIVTLVRNIVYERSTEIFDSGNFTALIANSEWDNLWMALQQVAYIGSQLGFKVSPFADTGQSYTITATPTERANKGVGFDASGNLTVIQDLLVLPASLTALDYARVNSAATGYELRTPAQVYTDIGANNASNITAGTIADTFLPTTMAGKTLTTATLAAPTINGATLTGTISGGTFTSTTLSAPTVSGGTIDNAVIGGTTPAAITGTTITANTQFIGTILNTNSTTALSLKTTGGVQLEISNTASAVDFLAITGASTGGTPSISASGSDTNIGINLAVKGSGVIQVNGVTLVDASNNIPVARLASGLGATNSTFWRGDGTWAAPSTAGFVGGPGSSTDGFIPQWSGSSGTVLAAGLSPAALGGIGAAVFDAF